MPAGSAPGFRRPVVMVQGNALNRSRLATVVCVPLRIPKLIEQILASLDIVLGR